MMTPDRIRALRERLGLSRAAFASQYGVGVSALTQWETGRRKPELAAQTLLRLIERAPDTVGELIAMES